MDKLLAKSCKNKVCTPFNERSKEGWIIKRCINEDKFTIRSVTNLKGGRKGQEELTLNNMS